MIYGAHFHGKIGNWSDCRHAPDNMRCIFPGIAAELTLEQLSVLEQDSAIDVISSDEPVATTRNMISQTELATSASGAIAALQNLGAAGAGIGVAVIDSGISMAITHVADIIGSNGH